MLKLSAVVSISLWVLVSVRLLVLSVELPRQISVQEIGEQPLATLTVVAKVSVQL